MTNKELTGYDPYDGYYDGYPAVDMEEYIDECDNECIIGLCSTGFDSRAFAMRAWHRTHHKKLHPAKLQPYLGYAPWERIQNTLDVTTQFHKMIIRLPLRKHLKGRFNDPFRLEEAVSSDWRTANCRSIGHGYIGMQVFYGIQSHCIDVEGGKSKAGFPNFYKDFIRKMVPHVHSKETMQMKK